MILKRAIKVGILALILCTGNAAIPDAVLYDTVRKGDAPALEALLTSGLSPNHRDAAGNSLLMQSIVYGGLDLVELLLAKGADVNATNNAGVTALMRAAGNTEKIRLLVEHKADVNARSMLGNTPLILAARAKGSAGALKLLLERGADVNATNIFGANAIMTASASGDIQSVRLLLRHGADANTHSRGSENATLWGGGRSPLLWATFRGNNKLAKILLEAGADVNAAEGMGSALSQAAWADHVDTARILLKKGADVNQPDVFSGFTPLHWAAESERGYSEFVELLLKHGANPNAIGGQPIDAFREIPQTPLMSAKKRGDTAIVKALLAAGAEDDEKGFAQNQAKELEKPGEVTLKRLSDALNRAVGPLQETATFSKGAFLRHSSKQNCVSCHQQYLPLIATGYAKKAGVAVDQKVEEQILALVREDNSNLSEIIAQATFHPEPAHSIGYGLMALAAQKQPADSQVDTMINHLLIIQGEKGQWHNNLLRPPMQSSDVGATALAIHSLKAYPLPGRQEEIEARIEKARKWLRNVEPFTTEERAYQLLGLSWAGESPRVLEKFGRALVKEQRADGGWSQLPTLKSDAYGTGLALFALHTSMDSEMRQTSFQRGLDFLLRTQCEDGTWLVERRAFPFQPTMRSGYPHNRDSWISATGSSWAVVALSLALSDEPVQVSAR